MSNSQDIVESSWDLQAQSLCFQDLHSIDGDQDTRDSFRHGQKDPVKISMLTGQQQGNMDVSPYTSPLCSPSSPLILDLTKESGECHVPNMEKFTTGPSNMDHQMDGESTYWEHGCQMTKVIPGSTSSHNETTFSSGSLKKEKDKTDHNISKCISHRTSGHSNKCADCGAHILIKPINPRDNHWDNAWN